METGRYSAAESRTAPVSLQAQHRAPTAISVSQQLQRIDRFLSATDECFFSTAFYREEDSISDLELIRERDSFVQLLRVVKDFQHAAMQYGRIIISEHVAGSTSGGAEGGGAGWHGDVDAAPPLGSTRTIHKAGVGGIAGGLKYVVGPIMFKLCRPKKLKGDRQLYRSPDAQAKEGKLQLLGVTKMR